MEDQYDWWGRDWWGTMCWSVPRADKFNLVLTTSQPHPSCEGLRRTAPAVFQPSLNWGPENPSSMKCQLEEIKMVRVRRQKERGNFTPFSGISLSFTYKNVVQNGTGISSSLSTQKHSSHNRQAECQRFSKIRGAGEINSVFRFFYKSYMVLPRWILNFHLILGVFPVIFSKKNHPEPFIAQ